MTRRQLVYAEGRLFVESRAGVHVFDVQSDGTLAEVAGSPFSSNASAILWDSSNGIAVTPDGKTVFMAYVGSVERHDVAPNGPSTYASAPTASGSRVRTDRTTCSGSDRQLPRREPVGVRRLRRARDRVDAAGGGIARPCERSTGLEFDATGTFLYGGDSNLVNTSVNAFTFTAGQPVQTTYYLTVASAAGAASRRRDHRERRRHLLPQGLPGSWRPARPSR